MRKILSLVSIVVLTLGLSSCGHYNFQDVYRYPCQDPANFGTPDCEPPACEASGMCTKDILPQLDTRTSQVQENGGSQ